MSDNAKGIYVESRIQGSMDELWQRTQDPLLHQRWDLRFSEISYLPRPDSSLPQRFLYRTRIGFGLNVDGEGESVGTFEKNNDRSSALQFSSANFLSLIRKGSGYWKYLSTSDGLRFLTWYDYEVRFGAMGRGIDTFFFRPLMGWATAWSFDRLRLWIEKGQSPELSRKLALNYAIARLTVSGIWIYHGLVPKLIFKHPDEFAPLLAAGVPAVQAGWIVYTAGIMEILMGLTLIAFWHLRAGFWITITLMVLALLSVAATTPHLLTAAFNPVSLNLAVIALSVIGLLVEPFIPNAQRCLRETP